eukprot:sb/3470543/
MQDQVQHISLMGWRSILIVLAYDVLTVFLPILPTFISSLLTGYELSLGTRARVCDPRFVQEKRDSSLTVLLLSITTLLSILPSTVFAVSFLVDDTTIVDRILEAFPEQGARIVYVLTSGMVIADAIFNPLIFMTRSKTIWRFASCRTRRPSGQVMQGNVAMKLRGSRTACTELLKSGSRTTKFTRNLSGQCSARGSTRALREK